MTDILLLGAGGHAQSCIEVLEKAHGFRIAGLVGTRDQLGRSVLGYPVLGTDEDLPVLSRRVRYALVCVGQIQPTQLRARLFAQARSLGFELPVVIADDAQVSRHAVLGSGTIVMHGVVVNAGAQVGANCILNTRCLVEHGAQVADHCHIATGAIVNGDCQVGEGSTLGSGCVLREGVRLGRGCLVGMGLALRHDLPDCGVFTGQRKEACQ